MTKCKITYFACSNHRGKGHRFGIKHADRRYHLYVIGKTGVGKSTLLKTLARQDIISGKGLALFDPHGDLAAEVRYLIPKGRKADLVYLEPSKTDTWYFNPLLGVHRDQHPRAVAGLVEVFAKLWPDEWGPRLEHLMRNVLFTLLEMEKASFADIPRLLSDKSFRSGVVYRLSNAQVKDFWRQEYAEYSPRMRAVVVAPLQNKVGAFLSDPYLRRVLTEGERNSFSLRRIMDEGQILIVNLAKGIVGEGPATLLGSLLVSMLSLAAFSRARMPEEERRDFFVYLDEFQTMGTRSLANMLSELRKYRVNLILGNQYFAQLDPAVRDAVLGNAGTIIAFRVGAPDAVLLSREMMPKFSPEDFVNLPNYHIYLRLMIDGQVSKAFSAETIAAV